jgi:hypothetical protein
MGFSFKAHHFGLLQKNLPVARPFYLYLPTALPATLSH